MSASWILRGERGEVARFVPGHSPTTALTASLTYEPHAALLGLWAYEATRYNELIPGAVGGDGTA